MAMVLASLLLAILCLCGPFGAQSELNTTEACDEPSLVQLDAASHEDQGLSDSRRRRRRRRRSRRRRSRRRRSSNSVTLPYVLQAYCGDSWLTLCDDVPSGWQQHNGAFSDQGISTTPPAASADSDPDSNYISIGGAGVTGDLPSYKTVEGWFDDANSNNLDFDMEGSIAGDFSDVKSLVQQVQSDYPNSKAQVTCLVNTYSTAEKYKDDFDYFGIMIHGDSMTSGSYSIPCDSGDDPTTGGTWKYIKEWIDSDIPNSKIILSLTTVDLTACMVDWFKYLIAEYGLGGMSFWYWNQLSASISQDCIESQAVQCDTSDDFKCSAVCNGGSADGQCCDKDVQTTVGNCTTLGQEGCCGGTADTTYCQAD